MLRQTLGWLKTDGEPVQQDIRVSYRDLIQKARVSNGSIGKALEQSMALSFIECTQVGIAKSKNNSGQPASFRLRWDDRPQYSDSFSEFAGFYSGEGYRTPVPNAFFDEIVPKEPLAVTKTVGAIVRHTIGYQNQFGGRRQETPLSLTDIQKYTHISKRTAVVEAIKHAQKVGYISRVQAGTFSPDTTQQSKSVYAIRWLGQADHKVITPKKGPEGNDSKKVTSITPKRGSADHSRKGTSIKTTKPKDTFKRQPVEFLEAIKKLEVAGFDSRTADKLARSRGADVVHRQLAWLSARNPQKNRLGFLRKAIEEDWPQPEQLRLKERRNVERTKQVEREVRQSAEDLEIAERKEQRAARKRVLLDVWRDLSLDERKTIIKAAAKRERSPSLRNIILREKGTTEKPVVKILDELARAKSLPTVSADVENIETSC